MLLSWRSRLPSIPPLSQPVCPLSLPSVPLALLPPSLSSAAPEDLSVLPAPAPPSQDPDSILPRAEGTTETEPEFYAAV